MTFCIFCVHGGWCDRMFLLHLGTVAAHHVHAPDVTRFGAVVSQGLFMGT